MKEAFGPQLRKCMIPNIHLLRPLFSFIFVISLFWSQFSLSVVKSKEKKTMPEASKALEAAQTQLITCRWPQIMSRHICGKIRLLHNLCCILRALVAYIVSDNDLEPAHITTS